MLSGHSLILTETEREVAASSSVALPVSYACDSGLEMSPCSHRWSFAPSPRLRLGFLPLYYQLDICPTELSCPRRQILRCWISPHSWRWPPRDLPGRPGLCLYRLPCIARHSHLLGAGAPAHSPPDSPCSAPRLDRHSLQLLVCGWACCVGRVPSALVVCLSGTGLRAMPITDPTCSQACVGRGPSAWNVCLPGTGLLATDLVNINAVEPLFV